MIVFFFRLADCLGLVAASDTICSISAASNSSLSVCSCAAGSGSAAPNSNSYCSSELTLWMVERICCCAPWKCVVCSRYSCVRSANVCSHLGVLLLFHAGLEPLVAVTLLIGSHGAHELLAKVVRCQQDHLAWQHVPVVGKGGYSVQDSCFDSIMF